MTKPLIVAAALLAASAGAAFAQQDGTINVWGARLNPTQSLFGAPPVRAIDAARSVDVTGSTEARPVAAKRGNRAR